ncbi:MAG: HEPN domain-containing protein [Bryobacteraceae bacterium]
MKLVEPAIEYLMSVWIRKADGDLGAAEVLAANVAANSAIREAVGFHCQQAVEKYVKALLTYYQVEFPKTHEIKKLLLLLSTVNPAAAEALAGTHWLTPFGVDVRYADDAAQMLPDDEVKALKDARLAKEVVLRIVNAE